MRATIIAIGISFLTMSAAAQKSFNLNYAPYQFSIDYQRFFGDTDHAVEMGIFLSARSQFPLLTDKNEFYLGLELTYQNKLFTINDNGLATLGFGVRANDLPYESVSIINFSIPASFQWYFKEQNAMVRLRLTALVGTSVDVIPSLGFGYTF